MKNKSDNNKDYNLEISNTYYLYKEHPEMFANTVESNSEFIVRDLRDTPDKPADFLLQEKSPADYKMLFNINSDLKSVSLVRFIEGKIIHDGINGGIDVNIPETVIELPVTSIAPEAFYECKNVTSVLIPNSVTSIGDRAFSYSGIQWALIPHSVTNIDPQAFESCLNLKQIYLSESISVIKHHTFYKCKSLKGIIIPNSVKIIEEHAFSECNGLSMVILSNSTKEIGHYAFFNCRRLKNIDIPTSITTIGEDAFYGCDNLKIKAPNNSEINWVESTQNRDIFNDFLLNKSVENMTDPEEPDNIRQSFDIIFTNICSEFNKTFDLSQDLNKLLLSSLQYNKNLLLSLHFNFLKYIHIYNYADDNSNTKINLYIDYVNDIITDDLHKVKTDNLNLVYCDASLTYLIEDVPGIMDDGVLEVTSNSINNVLNPLYYPIIISYGNKENRSYRLSPFLGSYYYRASIDNDLKVYLDQLLSFTPITNYYYFTSVYNKIAYNKDYPDKNFALYATVGINNDNIDNECIKVFIREFKKLLDTISLTIKTGINHYQKRTRAVAPAISVVMNRNLRHNYGSHVLNYLCDDNIYEKLCDDYLKQTLINYMSEQDENVYKNDKNLQLPYFIRYLKSRIDYISELTLDTSNILTTRSIYNDVILGIDRVRILLNHISGVSNFKYRFKALYNNKPLSSTYDITAAFPNDIIGICAIWNTLENIVRNTSKHAKINTQQEIVITLDFSDCVECPGYYKVEIDNGVKEESIDILVQTMNDRINDSVLDNDTFELRDKNLGLVEMAVAAAYLRSLELSCIDSYEYRFNKGQEFYNDRGNLIIFKAINKNGALGYRFFVQKPKEFLFIGDWNLNENLRNNLLNYGIMFIDEKEFAESMNNEISFPHKFVIYKDSVSGKTIHMLSDTNDCKTLLPIRKLKVSSKETQEITKIINNDNSYIIESLNEYAWSHYYNNSNNVIIGPLDPDKICDYDQLVFLSHATNKNLCDIMKLKTDDHQLFVENFSSYTESKLPRFAEFSILNDGKKEKPLTTYWKNIINNKQIKREIIEAYREKVLVIDERIQKFSLTNTEGSSSFNSGPIPCSSLFSSTNVLIPDTQLDPIDFNEELIKEIEHFINENISDSFLLIHYGILERIYKNTQIITDKLVDWSYKAKRIVVTSGRGSHSLPLPPSVCYANLSSVLSVFIYNRNKFLINNLLYQSRRKHE